MVLLFNNTDTIFDFVANIFCVSKRAKPVHEYAFFIMPENTQGFFFSTHTPCIHYYSHCYYITTGIGCRRAGRIWNGPCEKRGRFFMLCAKSSDHKRVFFRTISECIKRDDVNENSGFLTEQKKKTMYVNNCDSSFLKWHATHWRIFSRQ